MSDAPSSPGPSQFTATLFAVIGGFAIFAIILFIAYLPKKPAPLADGAKTPDQRKRALVELRAKEQRASTTHGWIDQAGGPVRLPTSVAVELTIAEFNASAKP